jgi:hypothetical protein
MSSGMKKVVTNSRERALSSDVSRSVDLASKGIAEVFRYLMNVGHGTDDVDGASLTTEVLTQTFPLTAEIVSGFMAIPGIGTANMTVEGGICCMLDPDGATGGSPGGTNGPDTSLYKIVSDPGIAFAGTLFLTANSSGSPRVDVIEMKRNPDAVVTTESRDIYSPSTGLFTPTSVTKTTQDGMTYRIRTGTPGSGMPGLQQGWLPLAIALVPTGSTLWDTCTLWDVRPLLVDRQGVMNLDSSRGKILDAVVNGALSGTTTGFIDAVLHGRKLGGKLRTTMPGTEAAFLNLQDTAMQSAGMTPVSGQPWFLYLAAPMGVPRWARYSDVASGARKPRAPRGLLISSMVAPDSDGTPSAALPLPTSMGFAGATTVNALCVGAGTVASDLSLQGYYGDSDGGYLLQNIFTDGVIRVSASTAVVGNQATATYSLTAGTHYPAHARAILVTFMADLGCGSGVRTTLTLSMPNTAGQLIANYGVSGPGSSGLVVVNAVTGNVVFNRWVTLANPGPGGVGQTQQIKILYDGTAVPSFGTGGARMAIGGWKL